MNFAPRPSDRRIPLTETAPHHSTGIAKLHRSRLLKRVNTALKDVCQVKSSRSKVEYGRGECQRPRYGFHLHIGQGRPLGTLNMQGSSRQPLRVPRRESNLKGNSSLSQTSCNFGDAARNYMPMRVFARFGIAWLTVLSASGALGPFALGWTRGGAEPGLPQSTSTQDAVANGSSPQTWFAKGQEALQRGDLEVAGAAFRRVVALDPRSGAAYSNLGVIAMRRKEWDKAITLLRKAETLEPKMAGIRLNIGLVEYRRGNYAAAIAPLASFLREQPESEQARYLLGMCQVFTMRFAAAAKVLEPLWSVRSDDVLYLYLYDIAAVESGQKQLDEKILHRMIQVGGQTAEYHLILGKAFLNRFEVAEAKTELELAATVNPNLPFLHMNLGITYMRLGDNERAESEFRKDMELEPDLADNYQQLGVLFSRMQR